MQPFDFQPRTRVVFGPGTFEQLGELVRPFRLVRMLIVSDRGIVAAGLVDRAAQALRDNGIEPFFFHDFDANPDERMVEAGRVRAAGCRIDSLLALGGGSSLDCAKGINFVLTNGGAMRDYRGHGRTHAPLLPMIGVPTTAGTGSEAQSYALISHADTHEKMACGDPQAAFRLALLDPMLTVSQPAGVTAIAGYDALSHAVEAFVTLRHNEISDLFAREAWRLLESHFEQVLRQPDHVPARGAMLLGAHHAGVAIEQSMLGATHACANPLTARYGTPHGTAIALMLPHVVRWNASHVGDRYGELLRVAGRTVPGAPGDALAARLSELARTASLPGALREAGVDRRDLPALADAAAAQWTGTFNPRPFDATGALHLYEQAY